MKALLSPAPARGLVFALILASASWGCGDPGAWNREHEEDEADSDSGYDENDPLLGMTREEAAETMNGSWRGDILVSNDVVVLQDNPCFEEGSYDGVSTIFARFFCSPEAFGIGQGSILINEGLIPFTRRISSFELQGDLLVAETEPVMLEEMLLFGAFREVVVLDHQEFLLQDPSQDDEARSTFTINANWTLYEREIGGLDFRIKLGGKIQVQPVLDFDINLRLCTAFGIPLPWPCGDYVTAVSLINDVQLLLVTELGDSFSFGQEYPLPWDLQPQAFGFDVADVPVQGGMNFDASLFWQVGAEAKIVGQVGVGAKVTATLGVGGTLGSLPENLSGVDFTDAQFIAPDYDIVQRATARVGINFKPLVTVAFGSVDFAGTVSPYVETVAQADCDEVDLTLRTGVSSKLATAFGWGPLSVNASFPFLGLGPWELWGTSVPVDGLLAGDPDCTEDEPDDDPPPPDNLPLQESNAADWFQDHLDSFDPALVAYWEAQQEEEEGAVEPEAAPRTFYDLAISQTGGGYWLVDTHGVVETYGDAEHHGQPVDLPAAPIQGVVPLPGGGGYWLYTAAGRVYEFGDAAHQGDPVSQVVEASMMDMAATSSGNGYWLVAADGTVHAFGDAEDHGSLTDLEPTDLAMALVPMESGTGYWIATLKGRIVSFGDARVLSELPPFEALTDLESVPGDPGLLALNGDGTLSAFLADGSWETPWEPVSGAMGLAVTPSGEGCLVVTQEGSVLALGDAPTPAR